MTQEKTLPGVLGKQPVRSEVIRECMTLLDRQVSDKSGISGIAIKGAYAAVKRIKPQFVAEAIDGLLDEWLEKLDPYYLSWQEGAEGEFANFLATRSEPVSEDLLAVTDLRADKTKHGTVKKAYQKLRPSAKRHVSIAVPEIGAVIDKKMRGTGS